HQIPLKQLCSLIGYRSNDIDLIKKAIKSLISTVMEWNLLDDSKFINEANFAPDTISWNASSLLAGASIERGLVRYSYSPQIKTVLSSLEIYGRINLFVQSKFNSAYSLVLYENCVRFKNIGRTSWFKLDLFRSLMGLTNGQYELFKELKRNVITVAVSEINQKSDIYIEAEYQKIGRTISAIKFTIAENETYQPSFKRATKPVEKTNIEHQNNSSFIEILTGDFSITKRQAEELIYKYDEDYLAEKINLVRKTKKVENPGAYLISALKNDYKETSKTVNSTQSVGGNRNTYLRETEDASQVRSLKKKYVEYKFKVYLKFLAEKALLEKTQDEFIVVMKQKNPVMASIYQKKDLKSHPAMVEFIEYVDGCYPENRIAVLEFDEYLTEEETV
ncbi:MAG: replication initiation protein, partial [Gammaproteobacteria bacterium]